jgi:hypothetical protein
MDAMDAMKSAIVNSQALRPIDYTCDRDVFLSVDTSHIAVGFVLSQTGLDGKRYPSRFGSIPMNATEARYSQPKLELYGLFRALKQVKIYVIGVRKLVVEMDASCIKGMLNNPDVQPGASINRWIAGIKLFDFKLVHIPATAHKGPDGLSRRTPTADDDCDGGRDADEWVDHAYNFYSARSARATAVDCANAPCLSRLGGRVHAPAPVSCFSVASAESPSPSEPVIPRGSRAQAADERVQLVDRYLRSPLEPLPLSADALRGFLRYASDFFLYDDKLWRRGIGGAHQLVIAPERRLHFLRQAHDELGHKGKYAARKHLLLRFWWPYLDLDVSWFDDTCLECQKRRTRHIVIPPTVAYPAPLFRKLYVDTMHMPAANKLKYIVHGRCSLTGWPEWRALAAENAQTIGRWLFEDVLCRWGALEEIVTDNGTPFVAAAKWLAEKYGVHHIRISPYNSRANGIIERPHYDVREAIVKTAGADIKHWYKYAPYVFWAERVTTKRATGHSPFFMAHGVEPLLPFDVEEATWLLNPVDGPLTTSDLIAARARALEKRDEDVELMRELVFEARVRSSQASANRDHKKIADFDFKPGALVLVRNRGIDGIMDHKIQDRYFGPMVVVRRNTGGAYTLAELDGALSKLRFGASRLVPYQPREELVVDISHLLQLAPEELEAATADDELAERVPNWDAADPDDPETEA